MKNQKIFTFNFDVSKTGLIRNALEERFVFKSQAKKDAQVKELASGKRKNRTVSAFDTIYVALTRIEDTLIYINSLKLGEKENQRSAFDFFDFLNSMYVVVHCVRTLAVIFGLGGRIKEIEKSTECFCEKGIEDKGCDSDFFEYIRSLTSVHPTDTTMHPAYHGSGGIHSSPFVVWTLDDLGRRGDLSVHIYTSEENGDIETLQLYVCHFAKYLEKWIAFMDEIVAAIKKFQSRSVDELVKEPIPTKDKFDSYSKYIQVLINEYKKRDGGDCGYILEYYEKLFSIELTDTRNMKKFELYKKAIQYSLEFLHTRLQNMCNDDTSYTGITRPEPHIITELYIELWNSQNHNGLLGSHHYELEKTSYLDDSGSYNEQYSRELLEDIKHIINKYVFFSNEESAFETKILVSMALYFESLQLPGLLNRNIPNSLEYREKLLTDKERDEV